MLQAYLFFICYFQIWVTGEHSKYNVTSLPFLPEENPVQYALLNNFTHVNFEPYELSQSEVK
jgi:hypothetical protein